MEAVPSLVVLFFYAFVSVHGKCPARTSSDSDRFEITERFNSFRKANKVLSVSHIHERRSKDEYKYEITLCPDDSSGVAVKQTNSKNQVKVLGRVTNSTIFGGVDWIMVIYGAGDAYTTHCGRQKRQAWLLIQCEEGARKEVLRVIEENRNYGLCYYLFEYNHASVCSRESVKRPRKLSGGTIFCIVLGSLVAAYIIFGLLYMRFIAGAKGFEQIPNYSFWREIGNLAADGCDFVCRRPDHPANTYKGMADALNIDSSDDEKDDQLLPM